MCPLRTFGDMGLVFGCFLQLPAFPMSGELLAKCGCAHCGTHLEFPIEAAGTVISCPNCGVSTELTLDRPLDAGNRVPVGELLAAFNGSIRRPCVSVFYQFGLVLA